MNACTGCRNEVLPGASFCGRCGQTICQNGADLPLTAAVARASRWLADGESDRAIALLLPHAETNPPDPMAAFALGTAYLQRGRYADALPHLAFAVSGLPRHAHAHAYLGMAYLHTFQPSEARSALDEALRLAPDDFVVNLKYGELLVRLGYFREAIAPLERALTATSPDGNTLEFARRLLRLARQKAPNTFTRPVGRLPNVRRISRLWRRRETLPPLPHAAEPLVDLR